MATYTTLRKGSSGSDVKKLQNALINAGYDVGSSGADGIYGAKTAAAVTAYQKANNLTVDGIAGNQTLGSLYSSNTTPEIKGVDQSLVDEAYNSTFKGSDGLTNLESTKNDAYDKYNEHINKDAISQETKDAMNKKFETSEAFNSAWASLQSQAQALQSGKTSWTDRYNEAIEKYLNREDFSYDVDSDQLFQQALSSAMRSGKSAMQDTIGQASALTGGYGSTYATSAGNQAYNSFIEDAYNNLPEYYQMALQAYQAEGEEMFNQVAMLGDADAQEYQKMYNSFQVNSDLTQQMYNREFGEWDAGVTQAFNSANLQLNEYGQKSSDLYNSYSIASNEYENKYAKERDSWLTDITNKQNLVALGNSDYWAQTNYDESIRQFNESLAEDQRQFDMTFKANYTSDGKGGYVAKTATNDKLSNGASSTSMASYKQKAASEYAKNGESGVDAYINSLGLSESEEQEIFKYLYGDGKDDVGNVQIPLVERTFTKTKETGNSIFGSELFGWEIGKDWNDEFEDQYGNKFTLSEIKEQLKDAGVSRDVWNKILKDLTSTEKGKTYTYSK